MNETKRLILEHLDGNGWVTTTRLARLTGRGGRYLSRRAQELVDEGRVRREVRGGSHPDRWLLVTPALIAAEGEAEMSRLEAKNLALALNRRFLTDCGTNGGRIVLSVSDARRILEHE